MKKNLKDKWNVFENSLNEILNNFIELSFNSLECLPKEILIELILNNSILREIKDNLIDWSIKLLERLKKEELIELILNNSILKNIVLRDSNILKTGLINTTKTCLINLIQTELK